jgi:prevent-host-death family protein
MTTMTAADAKNSFGKFLDMAQREPVLTTKNDRPVGVFLSMADLEGAVWVERASQTHKESRAVIKRDSI